MSHPNPTHDPTDDLDHLYEDIEKIERGDHLHDARKEDEMTTQKEDQCEHCGEPRRNMLDLRTGKKNLYHLHPEDCPPLITPEKQEDWEKETRREVEWILRVVAMKRPEKVERIMFLLAKERERERERIASWAARNCFVQSVDEGSVVNLKALNTFLDPILNPLTNSHQKE